MNNLDLKSKAIISNNCWASGFYKVASCAYNTPFVGLYLKTDDYIELLNDFRQNIYLPISISFESRQGIVSCPVGQLGEYIEIFFLHYSSCQDANEKWRRRVERLPTSDDDLLIKICDRDGFEQRHIRLFEETKFQNKVGFLKKDRFRKYNPQLFYEIECDGETCPSGTDLYQITKDYEMFNEK